MESRVVVLEALAAQVTATLAEMRREAQEFRLEVRSEFQGLRTELRTEIRDLRAELRTEVRDLRRIHDCDFRITFGAIITATLGLAALMAYVAHWI